MPFSRKLQTDYKSYSSTLPFGVVTIFKRKGVFRDMIEEAAKKYPQLRMLLQEDWSRDNTVSFVWRHPGSSTIFLFITDEMTIDIVVHESVHVVSRIFEIIGAPITEDTEEFFAYYQETMFRDILKTLKNKFNFTPKMYFNK